MQFYLTISTSNGTATAATRMIRRTYLTIAAARGLRGIQGPQGEQGPAGPQGEPGDGADANVNDSVVIAETPSGLVDGSNATFTSAIPFIPGTVELKINGLYQKPGIDFSTIGNNTILISDSPTTGEKLLINYIKL